VEKLTEGPIGPGTRFEGEWIKGNPMVIEYVRFVHNDMPIVMSVATPVDRRRAALARHVFRAVARGHPASVTACADAGEERLTRVSAGQALLDVARPTGLKPPTF